MSEDSSSAGAHGGDAGAELGFDEALEELESLVTRLQDEEISIDDLGSGVARGAELVKLCRERLARAEVQVRQVIETLEADDADDDAGGDDGAAAGPGVVEGDDDPF